MCSRFRSTSSAIPCTNSPRSRSASAICRPASRGFVHAASADPAAPPLIQPNYLSQEEDRRVAADSIRLARKVAGAPSLARFKPSEYLPGAELTSQEQLARAAGDVGTTIFHPVGTAKMGRDDDPMAVVDGRLQGARPRRVARRGRFGHAAHHVSATPIRRR